MISQTKAAKRVGVDKEVVSDLTRSGVFGDPIVTDSGIFLEEDVVDQWAQAPVLHDLDDITDPAARELLADTGVVVLRTRPSRPRDDDGPEDDPDPMGYDPALAQDITGKGFRHWWTIADRAEAIIRERIADPALGGQPLVVTVRGYVVAARKVVGIHRGEHNRRDVEYEFAEAGAWRESMLGCWLDAGSGPRSTYWPRSVREHMTGRR